MIPSSFAGRLAEPSPQQTERDLAHLIHRTVELAAAARHELGYAAVNIGCDGVRRVTMFDGSACQTSGDVCLATREEGITVCLETPRGSGLLFQRVAFSAPVCTPVTGWWILDAAGYMYRVPTSLVDAAPYWPMSVPGTFPSVALMRSKTWAALMCGAALAIPLNGAGGARWWRSGGEGDWLQIFAAAIGGERDQWTQVPSVSIVNGVSSSQVDLAGDMAWILNGIAGYGSSAASLLFYEADGAGVALTAGNEYVVVIYKTAAVTDSVMGGQAPIGTAVAPARPAGSLPLAEARIRYGFAGSTVTLTANLTNRFDDAWTPVAGFTLNTPSWRATLLRDAVAPNAGSRVVTVTLPAAVSGVTTGAALVAYGYPLGSKYGSTPYTWTPPGTVETDCAAVTLGSFAKCYRRGLGVEYAEGHLCLDGADITGSGSTDYVSGSELDWKYGPALDVAAGVVALPGGEVALLGAGGDLRTGTRYRVRPAPSTAPAVTIEQRAKGAWPTDPNPWIETTTYDVAAWLAAATQFTVAGSAGAGFPGRPVPCVLWETDGWVEDHTNAAIRYEGTLGETTGGLTTLAFVGGLPVAASSKLYRRLTIVGQNMSASWCWTFEVVGLESALSPLTDQLNYGYDLNPPSVLYSAKITVPGAPATATRRYLYRLAWTSGAPPWSFGGTALGEGAVYDRMCRRVVTLEPNETNPVTAPITLYDEDLSLATAGTRPPSPLIYVGPITVESPTSVHLLQPMNL